MKTLLFVISSICLSSAFAQTKVSHGDKDYKMISETLTKKSMALINLDTAFLISLIDADFTFITSKGKALNKLAYLRNLQTGKRKYISQRAEITSIIKIKKVYYLTATVKDEFIQDGKTIIASYNTVNIFMRKRNAFIWTFGQSTEITT